jgi:hypothetical protein
MPPTAEVIGLRTAKTYGSIDIDPRAPRNTVEHIGFKLLELVEMGQVRSTEPEPLELRIHTVVTPVTQCTQAAYACILR